MHHSVNFITAFKHFSLGRTLYLFYAEARWINLSKLFVQPTFAICLRLLGFDFICNLKIARFKGYVLAYRSIIHLSSILPCSDIFIFSINGLMHYMSISTFAFCKFHHDITVKIYHDKDYFVSVSLTSVSCLF